MRLGINVPKLTHRDLIIQRLAETLREERLRLGLSQNEIARRAGLSHTMVLRVEKQERMPTIDTLLRIAEAMGLELGALITQCQRPATKGQSNKGQ
jgi:transcriptional regulator with XRE-family HTH domain